MIQLFVNQYFIINEYIMEYDIESLFKTQSIMESRCHQIQELKHVIEIQLQNYQQQFSYGNSEFNQESVSSTISKFLELNSKYSALIEQVNKFKKDMIQIFLMAEKTYNKNKLIDKEIIQKLSTDLMKQININKIMKQEVIELNELINQHVSMNKKKLMEKDSIIQMLRKNVEALNPKFSSSNQNKLQNFCQPEKISKNDSIKIIDNYQCSQSDNHLSIIKQEQESGRSIAAIIDQKKYSRIPSERKDEQLTSKNSMQSIDKNNSYYSMMERGEAMGNSRKSDSKNKTKFFIDDFRHIIGGIEKQNTEFENANKNLQKQLENDSRSSSQSYLSIGRNDYTDLVIPFKNISPRKEKFSKIKIRHQNQLISSNTNKSQPIKTEQNKVKFMEIKTGIKERQNSRDKINSKQKIRVTHKENTSKDSINNLQSKEKLENSIFNIPISRPNSKEKIALTTKNANQIVKTCKMKTFGIFKNNKKNLTLATQKFIKQHIQNINIYIGEKKHQLKYQGRKLNDQRSGLGRLQYTHGLVYQGQFKQNVRHGYGRLLVGVIVVYEGKWQRDKLCGQGTLKNINLINKSRMSQNINTKTLYYTGQFEQNKFHGNGVLYFSPQQKLVGRFNDGLPEGQYTFYNKFGQIQLAVWGFTEFS